MYLIYHILLVCILILKAFQVLKKKVIRLNGIRVRQTVATMKKFWSFSLVFNVDCYDQAILIAESDPFIHSGCKTYELRSLEVANKDNHYLL